MQNTDFPIKNDQHHQAFLSSTRPHILMITNHGIHQWQVIPGLPDTGGQNVFVNQMTDAMGKLGYKITIVNRGGYSHPQTGEMHRGLDYKDDCQRILYIEDKDKKFIRKEDMDEQIPELVEFLHSTLQKENSQIDLIISHYWDAAKIGVLLNERLPQKLKHIWIPHSVGELKKRNMHPSTWENLRVDERIAEEKKFLPVLDGLGATSSAIRNALKNDYGFETDIFLPPCVNTERFYPREIPENDEVWKFLSEQSSLPAEEIRKSKIVTEISRTDETKRKDILVKAFAKALVKAPDSLLIVAVDQNQKEMADNLQNLIETLGIKERVISVGSVWDVLPQIYAVTDIYCTPSVMEGFGMAIQEAAATRVPAIASHLVPFAVEYLLDGVVEKIPVDGSSNPLRKGAACIVVEADDIEGFAKALEIMLTDDTLRQKMAEKAHEITIPYFTWEKMTRNFFQKIGMETPN